MVNNLSKFYLYLIGLSVVLLSSQVWAGEKEDQVKLVVELNTEKLVEKLNQEKSGFTTNPERFYSEMDSALSEVVDFNRIAARVMGKYARQSSRDQKISFVQSFKRSLYVAYSKTLVESGAFQIDVEDARLNPRSDKKASVNLVVTSVSGNKYPVVYSMYRAKNGEWMLENVIVYGVNIGLAFRDRFSQQMRENKGDMNKVIAGWTAHLDDVAVVEHASASKP